MKTYANKKLGKWAKVPLIRGVVSFVTSLVQGTSTLMYSADVLEEYWPTEEGYEEDRFEAWINNKFGEKRAWNLMVYLSVAFAIVVSVGVFILLPTVIVNWAGAFVTNPVALNLIEGIFRLLLFVIYVVLISRMEDIKRVFRYHGAEHKTIHCFEKGLELTPENAQGYYTLHPRCGTSFLVFVMVISLILFSLLGWPNLLMRILSRLLLIPVVAGLSYEVLRWAGRSDSWIVRILSIPGLYMQKITTEEPDTAQLEVAIAAMKAVMVPADTPYFEGICDLEGNLVEEHKIERGNEA